MANAEKTAAVAEIADALRGSNAAVLTEYRGLTVAQLKELRRSLAGNATYAVVKNTLTTIALRDAGLPPVPEGLSGPTAIAFVTGDPVTVAKGLRDFARTHPLLVVKGGVMDGRPLTADEVRRLADLESREVLLAQMAGALTASLSKAVGLFAAPLSQFARVAAALAEKAAADPTVLRGSPGSDSAAASEPEPVTAAAPEPEPVTAAAPEPEPVTDAAPDTPVDADAVSADHEVPPTTSTDPDPETEADPAI